MFRMVSLPGVTETSDKYPRDFIAAITSSLERGALGLIDATSNANDAVASAFWGIAAVRLGVVELVEVRASDILGLFSNGRDGSPGVAASTDCERSWLCAVFTCP